jgi:hypothetical protein
LIITLGAAAYGDSGDTGSKTFWSSTRISVAGGQGNGTAYLLDGGDNTDAMSNVNMPFPFPDVGGGEKGYQFGGRDGARCGVTLWPVVGAGIGKERLLPSLRPDFPRF